ncbi:hypothetical protein HK405_001192, partial [Cladochytrium tenue]
SPLHIAAQFGHVEVAQLLLANLADVDARDVDQLTPLHFAAQIGHVETAQQLLANAAAVDARNKDQWTPLHYVAQNGHAAVVQLLLSNAAAVNARNKDQCTPLHIASKNGHGEVIQLLLANAAQPDAVSGLISENKSHQTTAPEIVSDVHLPAALKADSPLPVWTRTESWTDINYKDDAWDKKLLALLPGDRPFIDTIIDGAGGNIVQKGVRILKEGGVIVSYGMTLGPKVVYPATAFMRNIEIRGTKMGSRLEFQRMVELVTRHGIRPPVSRVLACPGLDDIAALNGLFEDMREAKQFGKLVVKIADEAD